ncbi:MAG: prepilin-type N-terminal cleavage/methylation domain-containing protein [Verrucomicrobia bacterium]|nr:prepilin-type N-terminal cleavage/methylation domain-containing protein [Verrucomicrobiota bacterium]
MRNRADRAPSLRLSSGAFTLAELLVVIALVGVMASLLISGLQKYRKTANAAQCISNMRTIASGIIMYTGDNEGRFPPYITAANGQPWSMYRSWDYVIKPYLAMASEQPGKLFKCPSDPRPYIDASGNYARSYSLSAFYTSTSSGPPPGNGLISTDTSEGVPTPVRRIAQVSRPTKCIMLSEWCTDPNGQTLANYQNQLPYSALTSIWIWKGQEPVLPNRKTIHDPAINYAFVDGHVEALRLSDITDNFPISGNTLWTAVAQ